MHYVYFLKSQTSNKIYVGSTEKDPKVRCKEHNDGTNNWTRANRPFELLYYESYVCKADSLRRETFYKSGFGRKVRDVIISTIYGGYSSVG